MKLSRGWQIVSSIGHGILLALAVSGLARLSGALLGHPLESGQSGTIFLIASLLFAPITVYFNTCGLVMPPEVKPDALPK